jgi:hypothetical protein
MTANPMNDISLDQTDEATIETATEILRRRIEQIERSRNEQPERLARARQQAVEARGWAVIEEPWENDIAALPTCNSEGERTGDSLTLPNITAKETYGARLAFDMLDCGDDYDRIEEVQSRYFRMVGCDPGCMFLLAMSALSTISTAVVPQMLDEIETQASNYETRVMLAEARHKAWNARIADLRGPHDDAAAAGVRPVDGYDIASSAFDSDQPDQP